MIIKSHVRGGFRDAAVYLKDQGKNEYTRLVEMSDPHVKNLDEAFQAMWAVSDGTKVKKSLHHVSINPMKYERLTDKQVKFIRKRLEEKYGYAHGEHQRVIVEHIKDGRQHFHVIWNRVNLKTGKPHYPYMHKKQSKIAAREIEVELGLKKPVSDRKRGNLYAKTGIKIRSSSYIARTNICRRPTVLRAHLKTNLSMFTLRHKPVPTVDRYPALTRSANLVSNITPSAMCLEQRSDFRAACEGKITWAQYFSKWGGRGREPSL